MTKDIKNVLVIGNGYDIAHGLETKYDDFINYIRRAMDDDSFIEDQRKRKFLHICQTENGFLRYFLDYINVVPGWVDLEQLIAKIVKYFELFISNYQNFINVFGNISWDSTNSDMGSNTKMMIIHCLHMFELLYDKDDSSSNVHIFGKAEATKMIETNFVRFSQCKK